jgi:hypothetical protein
MWGKPEASDEPWLEEPRSEANSFRLNEAQRDFRGLSKRVARIGRDSRRGLPELSDRVAVKPGPRVSVRTGDTLIVIRPGRLAPWRRALFNTLDTPKQALDSSRWPRMGKRWRWSNRARRKAARLHKARWVSSARRDPREGGSNCNPRPRTRSSCGGQIAWDANGFE